jgi:hypothetical protein
LRQIIMLELWLRKRASDEMGQAHASGRITNGFQILKKGGRSNAKRIRNSRTDVDW